MNRLVPLAVALTLGLAPVPAPTPSSTPTPSPSMIDLRFLRMKISAGDLYSAESILQYPSRGEAARTATTCWGSPGSRAAPRCSGDWPAASAHAAREAARHARLRSPAD